MDETESRSAPEHLDLFTTLTDNVLMLLNIQNGHMFLPI